MGCAAGRRPSTCGSSAPTDCMAGTLVVRFDGVADMSLLGASVTDGIGAATVTGTDGMDAGMVIGMGAPPRGIIVAGMLGILTGGLVGGTLNVEPYPVYGDASAIIGLEGRGSPGWLWSSSSFAS